MKISKNNYIIGGGILILLVLLTTIIIVFTRSPNDNNPATNPSITDPDEVPLPFTHALIVKINNTALWARDIDGGGSIFVITNWTSHFHSFDFYLKKNIYFVSTVAGQPVMSYSKQYFQLTQSRTWFANEIAVDCVHEKVYVLDGLATKINVFDIRTGYYNIISIELNQPKDIAIDPVQKCLFILQLSSILVINLDGSSPKIILERTDILAFEIDADQKRIYWATNHNIESVDYAGQNFRTVQKITNFVISLAVANNSLFWLNPSNDYEKPTLWFCKIIGDACKEASKVIFDDNAIEIKAYNFEKRQMSNPCKSRSSCEHMCFDSNDEPRCVCTIGWQLKNDSQSCETIDDYLLYVQGDFVKGRVLDFSKDSFTAALLPFKLNITLKKKELLSFDFVTHSHELIFSDDNSVNKINVKTDGQQISIAGDFLEKKINPAIDWITRNVYFIRINDWSSFAIAVRKIDSYDLAEGEKAVLYIYHTKPPRSLVVHPNRGFMFVTLLDHFQIVRANLDGTDRMDLGTNLSISNLENGLAIDYEKDRLFWFDKDVKKVYSADLECSNLRVVDVSIVQNATMINIFGDYMYISNLTSVWRFNKKTGQDILKILPVFGYESQPIRGAKVFSTKSQVIENNHPCAVNNGGCKRYCFAKPNVNEKSTRASELKKVCKCNDGEMLDPDDKNCSPVT